MSDTTNAPTTTTRATLSHLRGSGEWLCVLTVLGIASVHELWLSEDATQAVYVNAPDGGPIDMLHKWARETRDWPTWELDGLEAQFAAQRYVHEQACIEVAMERGELDTKESAIITTRDMGQAIETIADRDSVLARIVAVKTRNELRVQTRWATGAWSSTLKMGRAQAEALRDALTAVLGD